MSQILWVDGWMAGSEPQEDHKLIEMEIPQAQVEQQESHATLPHEDYLERVGEEVII